MPANRQLSLTAELVAAVERQEPDSGPRAGRAPLTDEDYLLAAQHFLSLNAGQPLRIFAYGSLIWRPEFDHVGWTKGRAHGWRRSFCIDIVRWRATPQEPGLMMALDRGGSCDGVVYELPVRDLEGQMVRLLRREASSHDGLATFRWLKVRTPGGSMPAFTFYAAPRNPAFYIDLPLADQARRLARAAGHLGSGAAYLRNTIVKLEEHGIHDSYLWKLQHLVAAEIRRMHPQL